MTTSTDISHKSKEAVSLFLDYFSDQATYNDPEGYEVNLVGGAGRNVEIRVKEEGGLREARFIFKESSDKPVVEWYSGNKGGASTARWFVNADNYHFIKGNGAKTNSLNRGTGGRVQGIILKGEGEVAVDHTYSCKGYHRRRTWTLKLEN